MNISVTNDTNCFRLQSRNRERKATTIIKGLGRNSDRTALASYIRLFEPMVIQALKVSEEFFMHIG